MYSLTYVIARERREGAREMPDILSTAVLTCIIAREGRAGAREMLDILSTALLTCIIAREGSEGAREILGILSTMSSRPRVLDRNEHFVKFSAFLEEHQYNFELVWLKNYPIMCLE